MDTGWATASEIAAAVARRRARAPARSSRRRSARIESAIRVLNAFTAVIEERALARARRASTQARAAGRPLGPLAGVPFAVKNLFDVAGLPTLAGSKINRELPPAARDATLIARLEAAGAVLVGALNMGEYAYDFTGENVHDGPSRNPHDTTRMTGGSSGGSGGAVAGGLVPLALGSDTNGSIRVPSSLCGIFGLKPTYGRLSRARTFPFVASLDHLGPLARSAARSRARLRRHAGPRSRRSGLRRAPGRAGHCRCSSAASTGCASRSPAAISATGARPEARTALERVADGARRQATRSRFRKRARARAAAYVITATEGAALHLDRLRKRGARLRPRRARPADRRRHGSGGARRQGAEIPPLVSRAQCSRCSRKVDAILAPATPCTAPLIGQQMFVLDGVELPVRANLGIYTQPISFIGLPVVAVPVPLKPLPIGVQIIAAPWREDVALRIAHALETKGIVAATRPPKA